MANYKFKYLRVTAKVPRGDLIRRIDVRDYSKHGREKLWDELDKQYPPKNYVTCYEQSETELALK